ncbi:MAG: hypothetical protein IPK82_42105 [Polyangiaceae bacterium]|nr:hypothetical protein [Polyangiaceae bacterium]
MSTLHEAVVELHQKAPLATMNQGWWFWIRLGPLRIPFIHPRQFHWHDLHHVALGYETNVVGEAEISAFELRTGTKTFLVTVLCVLGVLVGLFAAPGRTWTAFRRARGCRNLYGAALPHPEVLAWTVDDLRRWMGIHER